MEPRIYTYKITFPHQKWWYWGVHKEKKAGETYDGSPKVHKNKWKWFEYEKQVLEYFDTYEEARAVEIRLIEPDLNNPLCLNEGCGGRISTGFHGRLIAEWWAQHPEAKEQPRSMGLQNGKANITAYNNSKTPEERSANAAHAASFVDAASRKENMRRVQRETNFAKGTKWATNGERNKRIKDGFLPEGFRWGFVK